MDSLLFFVAVLAAGAVGALALYINQQNQKNRYALLGAVACSVCGTEGVEERGGGRYRCGHCGYDTDADLPPEKAAQVRQIQEIAIAAACLESAHREFEESRERTHTVRRDGRTRTEKVGPFHDRYLEGIEQAEEASTILQQLVDAQPALGTALEAIGSITPPPDTSTGFNAYAEQAIREVNQAQQVVQAERARMVQRFQA